MEEARQNLQSPERVLEAIEQTSYFRWLGSAADQFKVLRNKARDEGKHELARRAQFEIEICSLEVKHPFIYPDADRRFAGHWGLTDGTEWPDARSFTDEQLSYDETRLSESGNLFLRTRYADLLFDKWTNDRKLNKFELGKMLCDLMLESAHAHLKQSKPGLLEFLWNVARAVDVALTLNNREMLNKSLRVIYPVLEGLDGGDLRWVYEISMVMRGVSQSPMGLSLAQEEYEKVVERVDEARELHWQSRDFMWHRQFCEELLGWHHSCNGMSREFGPCGWR